MIELYKNGDKMAILTNAKNEDDFIDEISFLLDEIIDKKAYENDWYFQLLYWLPQIVEICCYYRGYKTEIAEGKVLISGNVRRDAKPVYSYNPEKDEYC